MALYDQYGRLVVWDAARMILVVGATVDDVVRILNEVTNGYNVLWMRDNADGVAETSVQPLAKYEDGAVKLWNISTGIWYNLGAYHNVDGVVTLYHSASGLPNNNSRFNHGFWEIKSDTNGRWYKVGTTLNEDGKRELYVDQTGSD